MKHIFYHLTAVMVVVVWGMTFISTKVLIVHGLSAQEIFLFRFLLAYAAVCPISFHRFFAVKADFRRQGESGGVQPLWGCGGENFGAK